MSQTYRNERKCNEEGYKFIYESIKKTMNNKNDKNTYTSLNKQQQPIMIGKIGANELLVVYQSIQILQKQILGFSPDIFREGCLTAGIFPPTKEGFIIFVKKYLDAIKSMNIMASWNDRVLEIEEYVFNNYVMKDKLMDNSLNNSYQENQENQEIHGLVDLCSLESFYTEPKYWWQNLYENKTILIITPFVKSIQTQLSLDKRDKVWRGKWNGFWSKTITFKYIKFPHPYYISSEEEKAKYPKSLDLLMQKYQTEIDNIINDGNGGFDIALIGTGAYSILLCDYIKRKKQKNAFHLGGGLQMMCGVYGHRWEPSFNTNPFLEEYINDAWIRPLPEEIPLMYQAQEGGAYF